MGRVHHTVRLRLNNIALVRDWVSDKTKEELTPIYRKALLRKIMINVGVTKTKAQEYIDLVLGEEE